MNRFGTNKETIILHALGIATDHEYIARHYRNMLRLNSEIEHHERLAACAKAVAESAKVRRARMRALSRTH